MQVGRLDVSLFANISPNVGFLVVLLKLITLLLTAIPPNWRNIQHSLSKLYECAALDWNVKIRNIMQEEIDELLQLLLSKISFETCFRQKLPILVSYKTIL